MLQGGVYCRDGKYYARWTTIPAKLIAEFQTTKDDPLAVYRELRNIVVNTPERASHENTTKLLRRYKDALPNDAPRTVVKECITKRLEELRFVLPPSGNYLLRNFQETGIQRHLHSSSVVKICGYLYVRGRLSAD